MADTGIQWTDKTWNPTTGCTRVSPGCKNCYAFQLHDMRHDAYKAGKKVAKQYAKPFKELQLFEDRLTDPLRWRKPQKIFVNSMSDLFHKDIPDEFIDRVFGVMAYAHWHTFQILTKRADRLLEYFKRATLNICLGAAFGIGPRRTIPVGGYRWPLPNVWLGVSVENQAAADERIPLLLRAPAAVRFLSCEPLLEPLNLRRWIEDLDWMIAGGESGPKCRPCDAAWLVSIVEQCKAASVPVFVKQVGGYVVDRNDVGFEAENEVFDGGPNDGEPTNRRAWPGLPYVEHDLDGTRDGYQGALVRLHLRDIKGGDMAEFPLILQVREYPNGR